MAGVRFTVDGVVLGAEDTAAPYEATWNTGTAANGVHVLTATARDAAGNESTATISVTVANDTTAPTVALISPVLTAVAGDVTFSAEALDDVGVAGVQFTLDGVALGGELVAGPYEVTWNSASVANGVHVLAVTARDAAGNQSVTASVAVTVANLP